ncbi:Uma2 family endonuclease [Prochlorothrix hollandica]|uniref:Uma2 family endonuclease n=1 Tax=Prochlorothrix hollandica TaxID=1223 RepID=UPI00034A63F7|nr:Uma2 family endonuclease [Prochlorothrix hollandica]
MLDLDLSPPTPTIDVPSLNHSYLCSRILRQLFTFPHIEALTELTLDLDNGLTPDICVYPIDTLTPNLSRDITRVTPLPLLAIEVISASQNIQTLLEKAERLVQAGVATVWTVEPYTRSIFVTNAQGETVIYNAPVSFNDITIDFQQIFSL